MRRVVYAAMIALGLVVLFQPTAKAEWVPMSPEAEAVLAKLIPRQPKGWLWAGPTDRTTTSRCYDKPRTPFCAIDEFYICRARTQKGVCIDGPVDEASTDTETDELPFFRYRLLGMRDVHRKQDAAFPGSDEPIGAWHDGDVMFLVQDEYQPCALIDKNPRCFNCSLDFIKWYFLVHRDGDRWHVVAWKDVRETHLPPFKEPGCNEEDS